MQQNGTFVERRNNWIHRAIELNHSCELLEDYLDNMYWNDDQLRLIDKRKDRNYYKDILDEDEYLRITYYRKHSDVVVEKNKLIKEYTKLLVDASDFADIQLLLDDFKTYAKDW